MEHVSLDAVDPSDMGGEGVDLRRLTEALGTEDLAINRYELAPGEVFSGGLHAHLDQEEIFYIVRGTATFEMPDQTVTVGPEEAIRFAPGEYQQGRNEGNEPVVALALGAPRDSSEIRVPGTCPACDHEGLEPQFDEERTLRCPACGRTIEQEE